MSDTLVFEALSCGHGRLPVVSGLSGQLGRSQTVALTGANGSGKSTVLATLAGQLAPVAGVVVRGGTIGYLPQAVSLNRDVPVTARQFAAMGLWGELGPLGRPGPAHRQRIDAALDATGLAALAERKVATLSGGEFRRLCIARVLLPEPHILLLDEPLAALDAAGSEQVLACLAGWAAAGRCVIASLHEAAAAASFGRRLHLADGQATWMDSPARGGLHLVQGLAG